MENQICEKENGEIYRNVIGSDERKCSCGSWKEHWKKFSGKKWPSECSVKGCSESADLGAHVHIVGEKKEWIVPMCTNCNNDPDKTFQLKANTILVSANKAETCDA